jgi:hypothetical protein
LDLISNGFQPILYKPGRPRFKVDFRYNRLKEIFSHYDNFKSANPVFQKNVHKIPHLWSVDDTGEMHFINEPPVLSFLSDIINSISAPRVFKRGAAAIAELL